jgi:uncharacterized membrane protein
MDAISLKDIGFFILLFFGVALLSYILWLFKRKHWAYLLLLIAYELSAYVLCDFFFLFDEEFNEKLFIALNLIGLIAILLLTARHLLRGKEQNDKK